MKMDGRDSAECQNWGKKGHRCHFRILNDNGTKQRTVTFSLLQTKRCSGWGRGQAEHENGVLREKDLLLSRFPGDPTVGSLLSKKESCSTRRGLRVGTGFKEFLQTP